ncbi:MAG: Gfo/Idh/MocA family oxidoreductase [Ignavibacteriales bacterium]|nr:Gfo/Idh/MocA family oxidoreductase [Ignavibacteriales bacterium]
MHRHPQQHPLPRRQAGPRARLLRRLREAAGRRAPATPPSWPASSARPGCSSASPTPTRAIPIVKHLRDLVAAGEIGEVRFVNGEYPQEWLADQLEDTGQKQAAWRTDPALAGGSNCVGDIGSHIEFMAAYMTGLEIESLCARLDRFGPGRALDDNATVLVDYKGGAQGVYWSLPDRRRPRQRPAPAHLRHQGRRRVVPGDARTRPASRSSTGPSGTVSRGPRPDVAPGPVALAPPVGPPRGLLRELRQHLRDLRRRARRRSSAASRSLRPTSTSRASTTASAASASSRRCVASSATRLRSG